MHLPYFNNFEYVKISQSADMQPKNTKYLHFGKFAGRVLQHRKIHFQKKMTHLTFDNEFDDPIHFIIPSTVTHLTFGKNFNQPIKNCIPSSVTHLTFGYRFDKDIANIIPSSVTHLTLDGNFYRIIYGYQLPQSIIEIIIIRSENLYIRCAFLNMPSKVRLDIRY
jgi:hypothetical protein